jgi:hypothetical protein
MNVHKYKYFLVTLQRLKFKKDETGTNSHLAMSLSVIPTIKTKQKNI